MPWLVLVCVGLVIGFALGIWYSDGFNPDR